MNLQVSEWSFIMFMMIHNESIIWLISEYTAEEDVPEAQVEAEGCN